MGREARVPREVIKRIRARRKTDNTWSADQFAGRVLGNYFGVKRTAEPTVAPTPDTLSIDIGGDD